MSSSPQMSSSIQPVSNDLAAVLAPALANAALLIAAPSLGCLRTYTTVLTDLYQANGLPKPDLARVFGYKESYTTNVTSPIVSNCLGTAASNMSSVDIPQPSRRLVASSPTASLPQTPVRVSSQIKSPYQDSPIFSRRVVTSVPRAGLPMTPVRISCQTKSPYKESPILSRRVVKSVATTSLPETAMRVSRQIKSPYLDSPILSRRVVTSIPSSGLPDSPLRVLNPNKSLYQDSPILPRRVINALPTATLLEIPVRMSPDDIIQRSPRRIVSTYPNKPNQGLKRKISTVRILNPVADSKVEYIHQKPAQKSFTCPGCKHTFRKEIGLRKHLEVNPMCTYSFFITC